MERDLVFMTLFARTSYLVFVNETLALDANAFDNRNLVALMATECFCTEISSSQWLELKWTTSFVGS